MQKATSGNDFFESVLVPLLRKKLGMYTWGQFVKYKIDETTQNVQLRIRKLSQTQLADLVGALSSLARACGIRITPWHRQKNMLLTTQTA